MKDGSSIASKTGAKRLGHTWIHQRRAIVVDEEGAKLHDVGKQSY